MKQGLSLTEMAAKIEADKARKRDVIVDSRQLSVLATADNPTPTLHLPDGTELDMLHHTHRQLGQRLGLRADHYDRLRESHPALYTTTVNTLMREKDPRFTPGPYMVRTFTDGGEDGRGVGRAFLSNGYRPIDHDVIAESALPVLAKLQTEGGHTLDFESIQITDSKLYIKVVIPTVSYNLKDFIDPRRHEPADDVVQLYLLLKNSEVGTGNFDVEMGIYRLVCRNGMTVGSLLKKRHVGKRLTADEDLSIYKDDTLQADDKALMLKLRDVLTDAVDDAKFRLVVEEFASAKDSEPMEKPIKAMEELAQRVKLSEGESQSALQHLLKDGDLTKFGAVNSITRMAQDVANYDRSTELEAIACEDVMRMADKDWTAIATAA